MAQVHTFPPPDDPGWYEHDVWDCPACGVGKIDHECMECPGCLCAQPEGSVYRGRCWGMALVKNPAINLTEVKIRRFTMREDESIADVASSMDAAAFLAALKQAPST